MGKPSGPGLNISKYDVPDIHKRLMFIFLCSLFGGVSLSSMLTAGFF